ncbi:MAG: hypothetical protein P4L79_10675 [Legionella sp.]|uniref:hypothetical protein n=1 Tax=Legionella sp. TaxID=459 RepID=UPI00283F5E8D|nr:hypothetical protein [Legionella sp.]
MATNPRKRKPKQELIPIQKIEDRYLHTVQNQSLIELGKALMEFRMVGCNFIAGSVDPNIIKPIDDAYQTYFDRVLDSVLNCHEMHMDTDMCTGLNRMLNTKRGFVPEENDV